MGAVFEAFDTRLEVSRAIKFLDPALSPSKGLRSRFEAEARIMAQLAHPNIVSVHDVVVVGDNLFIVMELVEGGSVSDRVERHGPLPPRMACQLVQGLLGALQVAHEAGVIHRDVKPQNVLISRQGVPKLTDFGIAQATRDAGHKTRTGAMIGTPAYMAPEQRLDSKRVGPAADLYAAGATLFSVLTGGDPYDLYDRTLQEPLLLEVPPPLRKVIERATEFEPEKRYASAQAMREAVEAAAAQLPPDPVGGAPLLIEKTPPPPSGTAVPQPTFDHSVLGYTPSIPVIATPPSVITRDSTTTETREPPPFRVPWAGILIVSSLLLMAFAFVGVAGWWVWGATDPSAVVPEDGDTAVVAVDTAIPADTAVPTDTGGPVDTGLKAETKDPDPPKPPILRETVVKPPPVVIPPDPPDTAVGSPEPPAPETSETSIRAQPRAHVTVDGAARGTTPLVVALPAGVHEIRLEPVSSDEGAPIVRSIVVKPGRDNGLCWDFRRESVCTP